MAIDGRIRASNQDRDSAAGLLGEAYAAGRLSREELDERAAAAYSAKTLGELRDITADLPPPAVRTGLPSDIVASRHLPRSADRRRIGQVRGILLLVLAAALAETVTPLAVWVAVVLIPIALLLAAAAIRTGSTRAGTQLARRR